MNQGRQETLSLAKRFIVDLESVFATDVSEEIPLEDLRSLGQALTKRTEGQIDDRSRGTPRLAKEFLVDLERIVATDASDDVPIGDLDGLGRELRSWTEDCKQQLGAELSKLGPDHPVNCGISLYGAMDLGRLEVAHTRTLAWLLNPNEKEHGFGDALLKAMLTRVCNCDQPLSFDMCTVAAERIYRNLVTGDAGRTDIWIEGQPKNSKPWLVVIEAKIDASEGSQQLDRYNLEIKKWRAEHRDGEVLRQVFLTTDGREATGCEGWTPASFSRLAIAFWEAVGSPPPKPGHQFLRLYLAGVLRDILDLPIGNSDGKQHPYKLLQSLHQNNTSA